MIAAMVFLVVLRLHSGSVIYSCFNFLVFEVLFVATFHLLLSKCLPFFFPLLLLSYCCFYESLWLSICLDSYHFLFRLSFAFFLCQCLLIM